MDVLHHAVAVVVDSSLLIDFLSGFPVPDLARAFVDGRLVIPPLVVAEVVTGAHTLQARHAIFELLQEVDMHPTNLQHWIKVGDLRGQLAPHGINVTIPDAHIAQCALDLDAELLAGDGIFAKIARHVPLRIRER